MNSEPKRRRRIGTGVALLIGLFMSQAIRMARADDDSQAIRDAYEKACSELLNGQANTGVKPAIRRVLRVPADAKNATGVALRQVELDRLIATYPQLAEQIQNVAAAYAACERIEDQLGDKPGPLGVLNAPNALDFRIAARVGDMNAEDEQAYRDALKEHGPDAGGDKPWRWFEVDNVTQYFPADPARHKQQTELLKQDPVKFFTSYGLVGQQHGDAYYLLLANTDAQTLLAGKGDWRLVEVFRGVAFDGTLNIQFGFDDTGAAAMGKLTGNNIHKPLAMLLDGRIITSPPPTIQSRISDSGQITGRFSDAELAYMIHAIQTGMVNRPTRAGPRN